MNRIQKTILLVGAILIMFQALYPPWAYRILPPDPIVKPARYAVIWKPPKSLDDVYPVQIDFERVGLTLAATILVSVGLVIAFRSRR